MIYLFHFFIILSLYIFFGRNKKTEKIFIIGSFVYVLFVFGQRWMTGTDFPNYLRYFITDFTLDEWGYFGIQTLLSELDLYFGLLIIIILFITQFNFYRFFLKFGKYATLIIAIFLISEMFFAQMSQIRQYTAISFFLNSYYYSYNSNYFKSIINMILAISFHSASLIFIPLLFIKLPISRKIIMLFFTIALIFPLIDVHIIFDILNVSNSLPYVGGHFDVPLSISHNIKYYAILILVIYYIKNLKPISKNNTDKLIVNGLIFYILIYGFSFHFSPMFRSAAFFQAFEIVFLVYYSDRLKNLPNFISQKIVAFLFLGIFSFSALADSYNVGNYQFRPLRVREEKTDKELIYELEEVKRN